MSVFERIKKLANDQGKGVSKVALDLGFSENLFYRWKSSEPKARDLEKVADYFDVSVDFLLGRTDDPKPIKDTEGYFRIDKDGLEGKELSEYIDDVEAYAELRRKKLLERKRK
ncbi:MAG: helix-turn-helix domain-containing protein [Enterococcus gallinarum]|nr:helix-turn-helix domain-containing protein [Enterococcus gallinarum]MDY4070960.1 helix-turn-helix transcriptional regulator [Enterococcus gallinarum]